MKLKPIRSLADAEAALQQFYRVRVAGTAGEERAGKQAHGLDTMRALMAFLGDPQNKLQVIHVAGTSGKTSTAYYCAALLQASGHKVGLTVSPHVNALNDRVQIDGQPLVEAEFCAELEQFLQLLKESGLTPGYPLVMMAFAFWIFDKYDVDYAVVEVGIGGLLDMSNVIDRSDKTCVITDIGFDHTQLLGDTLPEIAAQKAGIIQLNNTVVSYRQDDVIMDEIQKRSRVKQAELHIIDPAESAADAAGLPLFQQRNFNLACYVVQETLARDDQELSQKAIAAASALIIPGRMEKFEVQGKTVLLDGAHNPQKMDALMQSVAEQYPSQKAAAIVAFIEKPGSDALDRVESCLHAMKPFVQTLFATGFGGPEDEPYASVNAEIVAAVAKTEHFHQVILNDDPWQALMAALDGDEGVLVVAGSFYLLNHIRPRLLMKEF